MATQDRPVNFELLSLPWIYSGGPSPWEAVLHQGSLQRYRKNETIIQSGQQLDHLFYLRQGRVNTVAIHQSGQHKTLWFLEAGAIFGETPLFNGKPCAYQFCAMTQCEVYLFSQQTLLEEILPAHPGIALAVIAAMARKVHVLSTQIEDFIFCKPIIRVAKLIYLLYQENQKTGSLCLPVSQEGIADILGIHRVTVNQSIRTLKADGILDNHQRRLAVRDPGKLRLLAVEGSEG